MSHGFLYVLLNPGMPGLLKIGKTTRDPTNRVNELSSATGVPSAFILIYSVAVNDCHAAESWVHGNLESQGYRPNAAREFFTAPVQEAIDTVLAAQAIFSNSTVDSVVEPADNATFNMQPSLRNTDLTDAEDLFELGMTYLDGSDTTLADAAQAVRYFEQAAAMGYPEAASMLGTIYHCGCEGVRVNLRKSFAWHQKAVGLGLWGSIASMAEIFQDSGQSSAAEKQWVSFFEAAHAATQPLTEPHVRADRMCHASRHVRRYVSGVMKKVITGTVSLDRLRYFQEATNQTWAQLIASEQEQLLVDLYRSERKFLGQLLGVV